MKLILENWRKYCAQERIMEGLIREFDRNDREALMNVGEQFTISYEIELESNSAIGEGGTGRLDLDRARNYLGHDYFYDSVHERDADSLFEYQLDISDTEDLMNHYLEYELECFPACGKNQQQAFLAAVAIEEGPALGQSLSIFLANAAKSSDDNVALTSFFMNTIGLEKAVQFGLQIYEDKQMELPLEEGLPAETGAEATREPVFKSRNLPSFISKYFFNTYDREKTRFNLDNFPDVGLFDLLNEVAMVDNENNSLAEQLAEVAEFALDNIINPSMYATIGDIISGYGYAKDKQPILWAVQSKISYDAEEKAEELADQEYERYQDDPIDFLSDFGIDVDEEFQTEVEGEDYEEALYQHFPNFMKEYGDKLKYESDASLTNGVEFSMDSPKFMTGLDEAFKFLRLFFQDYDNQTNFFFDSNTGLHTNIGFLHNAEGEEGTSPLNLIKGLLFLNDDFAKKGFEKRKNSRWARNIKAIASQFISDRSDDKDASRYMDLLRSRKGIDELSGILSTEVMRAANMTGPKNLGMNITYINRLNYIEFRYPGNVDPTYDRMVDATLYYSHIVRTIFDKSYKRKEYIQKLAGFLSNLEDYTAPPDESQSLRKLKGMMLAGIGTVYSTAVSVPSSPDSLDSVADFMGGKYKEASKYYSSSRKIAWDNTTLRALLAIEAVVAPAIAERERESTITMPDLTDEAIEKRAADAIHAWEDAIGGTNGKSVLPVVYGGLKRVSKEGKKSKKDYIVVFYYPRIEGLEDDGQGYRRGRRLTHLDRDDRRDRAVHAARFDSGARLDFVRIEVPLLDLLRGKINDYHLIDSNLVQAPEDSKEEQKRNNILTLMGYTSSKDELEKSSFATGDVAKMISYLKQEFRKFRR